MRFVSEGRVPWSRAREEGQEVGGGRREGKEGGITSSGLKKSLLEVVSELKAALEAEERKSLEEQQRGKAQQGWLQLSIEE
jgi:hypothetical protein